MKEDVLIKKNNENNIYISLNSELTSKMTKDAYTCVTLNNTFAIFKSISNKFHLIFSNINNSIICYDLDNLQIINEIKNSHSKSITNFRHHLYIFRIIITNKIEEKYHFFGLKNCQILNS